MSKVGKKRDVGEAKLGKKETIKAVILADELSTNMSPVGSVCPSMLVPLVNARLLDYLIETLIRSEVEELYLYCGSHIECLSDYVVKKAEEKNIAIHLIISDGCRSLGDALRDIDAKGVIRGNFILIRGDAFTNCDLKTSLATHRNKCETDKGAALTLLFRDLGSAGDARPTWALVSEKSSKKVLAHRRMGHSEKKIQLELQWFLDHDRIQIDSSLIDTHVYMCSPSVLPLFSDNFDFQTMEDFIRGVLMNEEILDARIYWECMNSAEYALPMSSWPAYDALSRDILERQAYPLTPDTLLPTLRNAIYATKNTYRARTSKLARGCVLRGDTFVGAKSSLGENTRVERSVIGDNCTIADDTIVENSYVHGDSTITENCTIENCVIFSRCKIGPNSQLKRCILRPGVNLPEGSNFADCLIESRGQEAPTTIPMSELESESGEKFIYYARKDGQTDNQDSDSESEDAGSDDSSSSVRDSPLLDDTNIFLSEVIDSLLRGYQDRIDCDNLILEINSSRYAYNVAIREVTYNVVKAILILPLHYLPEEKSTIDQSSYQKTLKAMLTFFHPLFQNYVKTEDAQEDCLRAVQDGALTILQLFPVLKVLLHTLYDRDVLSEEQILRWYESPSPDDDDPTEKENIRAAVAPFISWLKEADEECSSDDS